MLLMYMAYVSATIFIGFGCGSALPGVGGSGVALRGRFFYIWHCWTAKLFWHGYRWSLPWGASGTALHVAGTANTVLTVSGHFRRRVQPIAIVLASGFGTTLVGRSGTSSLGLLLLHPRGMLLISLGNVARLWDTRLAPGDGGLTQGSWSTRAAAFFRAFALFIWPSPLNIGDGLSGRPLYRRLCCGRLPGGPLVLRRGCPCVAALSTGAALVLYGALRIRRRV